MTIQGIRYQSRAMGASYAPRQPPPPVIAGKSEAAAISRAANQYVDGAEPMGVFSIA